MSTVCVTGASGFVGGHIVRELVTVGHRVIALGRHRPPYASDWLQLDLQGEARIELPMHDMLVHCASAVHNSSRNAAEVRALTADASRRVFEAAVSSHAKTVVFLSTVKVFGEEFTAADESSACDPKTVYAESKLQAERYLEQLSQSAGFAATVLRLSPVYGVGGRGAVAALQTLGRYGLIPRPPANLDQYERSLVSANHVATVVNRICSEPERGFRTFCVADDTSYRYSEIYGALNRRNLFSKLVPDIGAITKVRPLSKRFRLSERLLMPASVNTHSLQRALRISLPSELRQESCQRRSEWN